MAGNFDPQNTNDRTVLNWRPASIALETITPPAGNSIERQRVVDLVVRVLYATEAAFTASRITSTQRDAVLDAWNDSWATFPVPVVFAPDIEEAIARTNDRVLINVATNDLLSTLQAWNVLWV